MSESAGIVYFAGGGPGDPGLITISGLERLRGAEVVVFDHLVHPALLAEAPRALLIDARGDADRPPLPQEEINRLLIEHARAGHVVVRLSDGDPFAFGGVIAEAEALAEAGVAFDIIPGVSSASMLLREKRHWLDVAERRPLLGLRVLNTRATEDGEDLTRTLRELGADPISLPATRIEPPDDFAALDAAITAIANDLPTGPAYDWIAFTSAHAVSAFMDRLLAEGQDRGFGQPAPGSPARSPRLDARALAGMKLAAVGPATAAALRRYGLSADLVPDRSAGRHLAAAFGDVSGLRILLPRSDVALRDLPEALSVRGAVVTEVATYATRPAPVNPPILRAVLAGGIDAVAFFSPSAINGLAVQIAPRALVEVLGSAAVVCMGETTAQAARAQGLSNLLIAAEASTAGVVQALVQWHRGSAPGHNPRLP